MKNRSILLAIGIAVSIFAVFPGNRVGERVTRAQSFIAADNGAGLDVLRPAGVVREVTAYNVGVREQTSADPCIGAAGEDICRLVKAGRKVCAANFVALGTVLRIQHYGECVVLDRLNRRFSHRVDIAMNEDAVEEAMVFGLKRRVVEVKD